MFEKRCAENQNSYNKTSQIHKQVLKMGAVKNGSKK
jgi:hypothetical protein